MMDQIQNQSILPFEFAFKIKISTEINIYMAISNHMNYEQSQYMSSEN